jgi:hypothetical protein
MANPGLILPTGMTPEDYAELVDKYGLWATRRALAFVPRTATKEEVARVAESLYMAAMP